MGGAAKLKLGLAFGACCPRLSACLAVFFPCLSLCLPLYLPASLSLRACFSVRFALFYAQRFNVVFVCSSIFIGVRVREPHTISTGLLLLASPLPHIVRSLCKYLPPALLPIQFYFYALIYGQLWPTIGRFNVACLLCYLLFKSFNYR